MHEIIPIIKKSAVSRLKSFSKSEIKGRVLPHALGSSSRSVKSLRQFRKSIVPIDRVFRGPTLRGSTWWSSAEYYLAFKDKRKHSISSIGSQASPNLSRMKNWVQFLTTPTADTPGTTLLLHFDNKRYLFGNVAEGTQRAGVQRKLSFVRVGEIFLTGTIGWANAGGLLGMILTLADATSSARDAHKVNLEARKSKGTAAADEAIEKAKLNIHGGRNLTHLLGTARRFVFRKGMPVYVDEIREQKKDKRKDWEPTFADDNIKVWSMVISPERNAVSPRKRSHEEYSERTMNGAMDGKEQTGEDVENQEDQIRRAVVSAMFDSEWRLDALVKKKLSEVKLPATIFTRNSEGKIIRYHGPMFGEQENLSDIDVMVRNPWPGAMIDSLPSTIPSTTSLCYIIKNHPQRGKFNPVEAKRLGVTPGKDFRALSLGNSVTVQDGSVVMPEMVLAPTKEGGGFAVVELPDTSYIQPLIDREEWTSEEVMTGVSAVIWILGPGVVESQTLQKFMQDHSELKHVVSSRDCCSNYLALESPASAAIRLHLLDPERFPILKHNNAVPSHLTKISGKPLYQIARLGKTIQIEPTFEIQDEKIVPYLDTTTVVKEASMEVSELAGIARKEVTDPEYLALLDKNQQDIPSRDAEVIALGTGSAMPSKYRNVSATLLRVPGYGNYLFDCGENTLGQLKRVFGDELPGVLRDLKAIWISHLHADHHLGTVAVIKAWHEETGLAESTKNNKLVVSSDEGMIKWLTEYAEVEQYGHDRLESITLGRSIPKFEHKFKPAEVEQFGLSSIEACQVEHCHGALAVAFNLPNGFKVAYSGDCRPSTRFAEIGRNATLLIHEATFDNELQGDAIAKKHSTTAEALDVGRQMNARRILLTHFSQRYQKIPVMGGRDGKSQVAIVAFDYMRVKIGDMAKVEAFKPALLKLYEDKEE